MSIIRVNPVKVVCLVSSATDASSWEYTKNDRVAPEQLRSSVEAHYMNLGYYFLKHIV